MGVRQQSHPRPTGGNHQREAPADKINLDFVPGNNVMFGIVNAGRHFEFGVRDRAQAEEEYPGRLQRPLTTPVRGLEKYRALLENLAGLQDRS